MRVGDLVKIKPQIERDPTHDASVGVVVKFKPRSKRCKVQWTNGVTTVPLVVILDVIGEYKKDKINLNKNK